MSTKIAQLSNQPIGEELPTTGHGGEADSVTDDFPRILDLVSKRQKATCSSEAKLKLGTEQKMCNWGITARKGEPIG